MAGVIEGTGETSGDCSITLSLIIKLFFFLLGERFLRFFLDTDDVWELSRRGIRGLRDDF